MKCCLATFIFIMLFAASSGLAQNLSQVATVPAPTPPPATVPTSTETIVNFELPLVTVEVLGVRERFFKFSPPPPPPKTFADRAAEITKDAFFQRQRFEETGQAIEIDRDHIYYRRDAYSYTKGIIFYNFFNRRMDIGLYKKYFSPASTPLMGNMSTDFNQQESSSLLLRNSGKVFFSLRVNLTGPRD
ncbi:MAG: hypothetical protein AB1489_21125 [Acidobacteriota bacterium]